MSEYEWKTTCERAIALFGVAPMAQMEADILEYWRDAPARVNAEIESIGKQIADGKQIGSPWHLLRSRLKQPRLQAVAVDTQERTRKIAGAENWIRNAGVHCDRWEDVEDELFGDVTGMLRGHDTPELRQTMRTLWLEQRPRGERAEAEHEAYMARWVEQRKRIDRMLAEKKAELDALQEAHGAATPPSTSA